MNKSLIVSMMVVIVASGLITGCGGKKIGGVSEEDFIEMNAQIMAISCMETDPEVMGTKMDEVLKKYGMTQKKLNSLSSGPKSEEIMKRIGPKIMKRAQELGYK